MRKVQILVQVRPAFNWSEIIAIPLATSIMETQAVVLVLMFGSLLFAGKRNELGLDSVSIMLLLLGLHWWAMFVKHVMQHSLGEKRATFLHLIGLCVAFGATLGTHLSLVDNIPSLVLWGFLIVWFWRLGMQRVQVGRLDEQLIISFKLGFIVLLALLCLAVANFASTKVLLSDLAYAMPIYFLSGLIALSFMRLSVTRRAYMRETPGSLQTDPTRTWFIVLTILLGAMVAAIVIFEVFTFQAVLLVLQPLLNALGAFFGWLNSLLKLLLTHQPPINHAKRKLIVPKPPPPPPPYHNPFFEIVLVVLAFAFLLLIILVTIREWRRGHTKTGEDEEREGLSVRATLRARRKQRQRRPKVALETLDPASARAHYRALLQAMARYRGHDLGRRPDETPTEYQTRLLTLVKDEAPKVDTPTDATILDELTRTYTLERYGGKITDHGQQAYLSRWVPHLVKRLMGSMTKHTAL